MQFVYNRSHLWHCVTNIYNMRAYFHTRSTHTVKKSGYCSIVYHIMLLHASYFIHYIGYVLYCIISLIKDKFSRLQLERYIIYNILYIYYMFMYTYNNNMKYDGMCIFSHIDLEYGAIHLTQDMRYFRKHWLFWKYII